MNPRSLAPKIATCAIVPHPEMRSDNNLLNLLAIDPSS
jgi:hypothetical protein